MVVAVEVVMTLLLIYFILMALKLKSMFTFGRLALLVFLLSMMASMLNAMTYLVIAPAGFLTTIVAVNLAMLLMTIVIVILLALASREVKPSFGYSVSFWLAFLFVWNEASMGTFLYALISGVKPDIQGFFELTTFGINSYLFVVPMLVEMFVFLYLERPRSIYLVLVLSILAMSAFNPLLFTANWFIIYGLIFTAIAMVSFMVLLIYLVSKRNGKLPYLESRTTELLLLVYVVMAVALFVGALEIRSEAFSWFFYALTSLLVMGIYFMAFLSPLKMQVEEPDRGRERSVVFPLVLSIFISSVFAFSAIAVYSGLSII